MASWTSVPGATSYRAEAGVSPTQVLGAYELGALTGFSITAPQGTYYIRVFARNAQGLSAPSNIVGVTVTSALAPPPPPSGLVASVSGSTVNFSVQLPGSGITGLVLAAGVAPGQTMAIFPLPLAAQTAVPNVPPGTYFARMHTLGPGGPSNPSNEVQVTVGGSGACLPPSAAGGAGPGQRLDGRHLLESRGGCGRISGRRRDVAGRGAALRPVVPRRHHERGLPGYSGRHLLRAGDRRQRLRGRGDLGRRHGGGHPAGSKARARPIRRPRRRPTTFRLPNRAAVVDEMARLYPGELRASCGNNTWLFRLVQRLRQEDTRWGLNWKRSRVGDMSQDAITYNYGPEADEGTRFVHVVDVIGGHCGGNPGGAWIDQTVLWSTGATWTLQPYTAAGYPR